MMTDRQEQQLHKAAGWLPPGKRAAFVRAVETHLHDKPHVTGSDLRHAITRMLGAFGVSAPANKENE